MDQKIRIVLIDDDQDACELLKLQLENTGRMSVIYSTSSEEAMTIIGRELPDIAILDVNMPGTHGVEIASTLAADAKTSAIPILYLSGMVTPSEVQNILAADKKPSIISKGSPMEELIAAIDTLTAS